MAEQIDEQDDDDDGGLDFDSRFGNLPMPSAITSGRSMTTYQRARATEKAV